MTTMIKTHTFLATAAWPASAPCGLSAVGGERRFADAEALAGRHAQ
jgi:hypothetical protein